jgi:hypothetical protein
VDLVVREQGLSLLIIDTGMNDDVLALLPVNGGGNLVFVTSLKGIDNTNDFILGPINP